MLQFFSSRLYTERSLQADAIVDHEVGSHVSFRVLCSLAQQPMLQWYHTALDAFMNKPMKYTSSGVSLKIIYCFRKCIRTLGKLEVKGF